MLVYYFPRAGMAYGCQVSTATPYVLYSDPSLFGGRFVVLSQLPRI